MPPEAFADSYTEAGTAVSDSDGGGGGVRGGLGSYDARRWDSYSLGVVLWQLWHRDDPWEVLS